MNYWFWLITPRLLLDKQLDTRDLRPGAIMGMFGSTALWVLSLLILPGWFSWYGRGFGGVGIALAMLSWTYVVSIVWVVIVVDLGDHVGTSVRRSTKSSICRDIRRNCDV